ncbi:fumarylacetoacetate hydrolase family protein [Sphingomonas sp.]|uniref:fumarylacetoacetate hydrolase family protein n=1 Tax=Sphingomonas sp. TaxID=28214 RepID=UPI001ED1C70D|nr:fumarylacetoacetate hydrolase family protein [Sphingomonas sp.]MBX3592843.1 fumarylacetoacetate hydrolase family protein [Sphingomonas sp.]
MRLATFKDGSPDGRLMLVSSDGARALPAGAEVPDLLDAIGRWEAVQPLLRAVDARLAAGEGEAIDPVRIAAPLPRSWQWLDGSAFSTHGDLMQIAFGLDPINADRPLMYQGLSDRFYGPNDDVPFPSTEHGIDFEGEFGVIVDAVPMGTDAERAMAHIRLIVQINDWSLRAIAPVEMKTGFGWVQAKPACSMAPFAVTPEELGDGWRDGRVCLDLEIDWNGRRFGAANGREMAFGFHELVAHAALTRDLVAGTIIGSGTVSNADYARVGSSCISEVRAIEMIAGGKPETPFMAFGDRIAMLARGLDGRALFGAIDQQIKRR